MLSGDFSFSLLADTLTKSNGEEALTGLRFLSYRWLGPINPGPLFNPGPLLNPAPLLNPGPAENPRDLLLAEIGVTGVCSEFDPLG